mgnify:CR=1 FL=1
MERPRAGVDYPGSWSAFTSWFPDDEACRAYLARLRWPEGFVCPSCGGGEFWVTARGLWMCQACGRQTSVTAGTIFHRTRSPLPLWFAACWFVCAQMNGTSALGLQRVLGLGSYETAWSWLHKLRRAMVRPDREQLSGSIELDETNIGGVSPGGRRARYETKTAVVIAVERLHPKGLGRIRMRRIGSDRKVGVYGFAEEVIEPGSVVYTDGAPFYADLADDLGVTHHPINLAASPNPAHEMLPAVHRVASLLKRWLAGTLHDGQSPKHLDYYLDEFTFRFNRRTSRSRGLLFHRLVQQALNTDPHPLRELTEGDDWS